MHVLVTQFPKNLLRRSLKRKKPLNLATTFKAGPYVELMRGYS